MPHGRTAHAGANGLANPRDFETPVAAYEDVDASYEYVNKVSVHPLIPNARAYEYQAVSGFFTVTAFTLTSFVRLRVPSSVANGSLRRLVTAHTT
jgi:hypothetical protein